MRTLFFVMVSSGFAFAGCYGSSLANDRPPNGAGGPVGQTSAAGGSSGGVGMGGATGGVGGTGVPIDAGVAGGGLPCDVETLMAKRCISCHGTTPAGGASSPLVTYADLTRPTRSNSSQTEAQASLLRMKSTAAPMPPSPATLPTATEIATLEDWINAGYPSGSCGGDAGAAPPPDPLNAQPTCTSNATWTRGNSGSPSMDPGRACIQCHSTTGGEAPTYIIAGTLYPTGHEPDNCNGVNGGVSGSKVVVTDNSGKTITLTPNSAGNFFSSTSLSPPYKTKVVNSAGVERMMVGTFTSGDCNSCHSQNGTNGAPGRVSLP